MSNRRKTYFQATIFLMYYKKLSVNIALTYYFENNNVIQTARVLLTANLIISITLCDHKYNAKLFCLFYFFMFNLLILFLDYVNEQKNSGK